MSWIKYPLVAIFLLVTVIYFGLPPVLNAMGFHPHYDIPKFNLGGKRALIVTTSHNTLGETGRATGVFGSEMTVPYYAFLDAGIEVDIASIQGGEIPVEPWSMDWPLATREDRRFKNDPETEMRATKAKFEAKTTWRDFFATHTVVDGKL